MPHPITQHRVAAAARCARRSAYASSAAGLPACLPSGAAAIVMRDRACRCLRSPPRKDRPMSDKSIVENLVELIKAYFSIAGVITLGVYLVKNVSAAPFHWHFINYLSGWLAIGLGSVIGLWYACHNFRKYHALKKDARYGIVSSVVLGTIMALILLLMISIVIGAVAMSCSDGA
jgi:hypothetical protein